MWLIKGCLHNWFLYVFRIEQKLSGLINGFRLNIKLSTRVILTKKIYRFQISSVLLDIKSSYGIKLKTCVDTYGSGHGTAAVSLPCFAINWKQNQVSWQPQFRDLTHIQSNLFETTGLKKSCNLSSWSVRHSDFVCHLCAICVISMADVLLYTRCIGDSLDCLWLWSARNEPYPRKQRLQDKHL